MAQVVESRSTREMSSSSMFSCKKPSWERRNKQACKVVNFGCDLFVLLREVLFSEAKRKCFLSKALVRFVPLSNRKQ